MRKIKYMLKCLKRLNVKNMLSCKTTKLTNVLSLFKVPVLSSMYKDVTI